jgi:hypothetical protein
MPPRARKATKDNGGEFVKVGDVIELESGSNGIAVLPDGSAVTVRQRYTIQHEGLHIIDGVEYLAEHPEK